MYARLCKRVKIFYGENENDKSFFPRFKSVFSQLSPPSNTTSSKKCQLLEDLLDMHTIQTQSQPSPSKSQYLIQAIIQTHHKQYKRMNHKSYLISPPPPEENKLK